MKKIQDYLLRFIILVILTGLAACGGGNKTNTTTSTSTSGAQRGDLVSVTLTRTYDTATLKSLSSSSGYFIAFQSLMSAVNVYKVVYWTVDPSGKLLQASGLLAMRQTASTDSTPILEFEHGTIFADSDAPTNSDTLSTLAGLMASTRFIVAMPDYAGYGSSVSELHPYLYAKSLANSSIDLLRASSHYLDNQRISWNGKLFLAGYSEGGYASVATHEQIQQNYATEFTVTADVAGDGPYDLRGTADTLLSSATLPYAPYVAFIFKAYDTIYHWNRISDIFQSAYVTPINNDFYGADTGAQIDAQLTNTTANLFTSSFLTNYLSSTGETEIKSRLSENNVYDWSPTAPLRLYHGKDDVTVPYANATTAQTTMQANGAANVTIVNCTPASGMLANHANCALPYLNYMLGYFINF